MTSFERPDSRNIERFRILTTFQMIPDIFETPLQFVFKLQNFKSIVPRGKLAVQKKNVKND